MSVVGESIGVEVEEAFTVVDTLLATVVVGSSEETLANVVSEEKFEQKMVLSSMSTLHC